MSEQREIEIRFPISPEQKNTIEDLLQRKGWEPISTDQTDVYFCAEQYARDHRTKECPYIVRTRSTPHGSKLTYKSFTGDGSWTELETTIGDTEVMRTILERIGQKAYLTIAKHRQSGTVGNIEANIDIIDGLGCFLELEVMQEDVIAGRNVLADFATSLSLDVSHIVTEGYVQLMEKNL